MLPRSAQLRHLICSHRGAALGGDSRCPAARRWCRPAGGQTWQLWRHHADQIWARGMPEATQRRKQPLRRPSRSCAHASDPACRAGLPSIIGTCAGAQVIRASAFVAPDAAELALNCHQVDICAGCVPPLVYGMYIALVRCDTQAMQMAYRIPLMKLSSASDHRQRCCYAQPDLMHSLTDDANPHAAPGHSRQSRLQQSAPAVAASCRRP